MREPAPGSVARPPRAPGDFRAELLIVPALPEIEQRVRFTAAGSGGREAYLSPAFERLEPFQWYDGHEFQ